MPTNYEKYFGSPEKASKTRVTYWGDPERVSVEHGRRTVASEIPKRKYLSWLKEKA